ELFVRSAAHVLFDSDRWKMWYIAGDKWIDVNEKPVPSYNIRYLESANNATWGKQGAVVIDLAGPDEFGFGRPFVIKEHDFFRMWYSVRTRSNKYRLGYAESAYGLVWERKDP